jgi:hypothetical protein
MIVNVQSLSFTLGEFEPFFISLALYNVKTKQKLSDTFHVDISVEAIAKLLEKKVRIF